MPVGRDDCHALETGTEVRRLHHGWRGAYPAVYQTGATPSISIRQRIIKSALTYLTQRNLLGTA